MPRILPIPLPQSFDDAVNSDIPDDRLRSIEPLRDRLWSADLGEATTAPETLQRLADNSGAAVSAAAAACSRRGN